MIEFIFSLLRLLYLPAGLLLPSFSDSHSIRTIDRGVLTCHLEGRTSSTILTSLLLLYEMTEGNSQGYQNEDDWDAEYERDSRVLL